MKIATLGQYFGGLHGLEAELQGNRVMRWIGNDHTGLRDVGLHLATTHRILYLANPALDLRIAHRLFHLVFQLLLGHLHALVPRQPLHGVVQTAPREGDPRCIQGKPIGCRKSMRESDETHNRHWQHERLQCTPTEDEHRSRGNK